MKITSTSWIITVRCAGLKVRRAKAITPNQLDQITESWALKYDAPIIELPPGETFEDAQEDNGVFIQVVSSISDSEAPEVISEHLESGRALGTGYRRLTQRANEEDDGIDDFL